MSAHPEAKRLSSTFDSVTLYGCNPDERPGIYGKAWNSRVSIVTLDNLKILYDGFDLCNLATSVSMTINGPAAMILAMFLNAAIDQQLQTYEDEHGKPADFAPNLSFFSVTVCARNIPRWGASPGEQYFRNI